MTPPKKGQRCNPGFAGATAALERAALRARELARATGTDLIVERGGKLLRVSPQDIDASTGGERVSESLTDQSPQPDRK